MVPGTGNENGADIGFAPFVGKLCVIFLPLDNFGQKPLAIIRRLGIPPVADASGKCILAHAKALKHLGPGNASSHHFCQRDYGESEYVDLLLQFSAHQYPHLKRNSNSHSNTTNSVQSLINPKANTGQSFRPSRNSKDSFLLTASPLALPVQLAGLASESICYVVVVDIWQQWFV